MCGIPPYGDEVAALERWALIAARKTLRGGATTSQAGTTCRGGVGTALVAYAKHLVGWKTFSQGENGIPQRGRRWLRECCSIGQ